MRDHHGTHIRLKGSAKLAKNPGDGPIHIYTPSAAYRGYCGTPLYKHRDVHPLDCDTDDICMECRLVHGGNQ